MKKVLCAILSILMCTYLCAPAFAAALDELHFQGFTDGAAMAQKKEKKRSSTGQYFLDISSHYSL